MNTSEVAAKAASALRRVYETMDGGELCSCEGLPPAKALASSCGAYIPFERGQGRWLLGVLYADDAARSIARAMLMMEADEELSQGDMADALGEVANMAAGLLKNGLLPDEQRDFKLGLPRFVDGFECAELLWRCQELATWRLKGAAEAEGDVLVCVGRLSNEALGQGAPDPSAETKEQVKSA
jgi:hypothetical protein